ncbi:FAD-dependent oxidoreductase [Grosmannia clavigera kw1407]|uniref:D-arabinono-1,4-lactone oxidase n=1 Tax=Grosmannia clavigera (strain kw1407 / UAMH 11150) TaxID=655863 RepID=F0XH82_GROCL|nr:FAD-dependent oxidoreductase [Grosmannia clavigera kw1407]EFX03025.1 FAD-dependent oxidoreductase [Grosmannia clavigera kw1407]
MRSSSVMRAALLPLAALQQGAAAYRWFNWNYDITSNTTALVLPSSEAELSAFLAAEHPKGSFVKVVGTGYGLSNLTTPVDAGTTSLQSYVVSLTNLRSIKYANDSKTVTFGAGWDLVDLVPELLEHGLQLKQLGSQRAENYVGAISSGTHGSGTSLPNMAASTVGFRLVDATGCVHVINNTTDPDGVRALQISLGALGAITEVTVEVQPVRYLKRSVRTVATTSNLTEQYALIKQYSKMDRIKFEGPTYSWNATSLDWDLDPTMGLLIWEETNVTGVRNCSDFCANGCGNCGGTVCYDLEPYAVAVAPAGVCDRGFIHQFEHHFPIEHLEEAGIAYTELQRSQTAGLANLPNKQLVFNIRFIRGDNAFMSPANTENLPANASGVFVTFEMSYVPAYNDFATLQKYTDNLAAFIPAFGQKFNVRPHWNKFAGFDLSYAEEVYPQVNTWMRYAKTFDPKCQFANPYLVNLLNMTHCNGIVPTTAAPYLL